VIGENVLVSHAAIVHGARIGSGSLIGIGARVLDGAVVGEEAIVAAGAVVPPGKEVPPRTIVAGVPAKPVREVRESDLERVREELEAVHRKAAVYRRVFSCE
jgi:carbonic anhydrase/acetyltransferase-like protein (isoleucine patch superfamily)